MDMSKLNYRLNLPFLITAIIITVLAVSCNDPADKYAKEASKWEKNIQQFDSLNRAEQYPDDAILFTGSSSITIWKTIKEDMAPYHAINRGFGGSKFSDLACYIGRITYPHKLKALVIFEANDISGSKTDKTPGEVADLFRYIVKKVRKEFPVTPIFLIEITPTKLRWSVWPNIMETNRLLKEACESLPHVYFIDTASSYLNEKGLPRTELTQADNLHQNRDGYLIWTKLIKDKLDQTFATTEKEMVIR
jgi:lysophospholipase L1-like esterase